MSLGVQALDDRVLDFLGRGHDAAEARQAVAVAQRIMPRSSFDLIYARPGDTVEAWRDELTEALSFADNHLSLYQLTIEKGTPFYREEREGAFALPRRRHRPGTVRPDPRNHGGGRLHGLRGFQPWRAAEMSVATISPIGAMTITWASGRAPTAASGRQARGGQATRQHAGPETWLAAVERDGHGTAETRGLDSQEQAREMLMMGLRLAEGVSESHLRQRTGCEPDRVIRPYGSRSRLVDAGYLERRDGRLGATSAGRPLLNSVLAELLA